MPIFKTAYFYFLAVKIKIVKNLKKIYFTTNFYNKSLKSNVPDQLFYNPNSYLLTSFNNKNNFSFKVSNINPDIFWYKKESIKETENLHNFFWLNLINRKSDKLILQKIINVWIFKFSRYKKIIWESSVISKRIISWILNADIILDKSEISFKKDFFQSIIQQTNHVKKNIKFQNDYSKRIEIICAILLTGLVFKEYRKNFEIGIKELKKLISIFFDANGFPISKNPAHLIKFSKYLILIKECIKESQLYVPDYLDEIIEKNLDCLSSIITPSNQVPLFNGANEINLDDYISYLSGLNYKLKKQENRVESILILKCKKNFVFFDACIPPEKKFSSSYQSGPLSFEYFYNNQKIITNCGFGNNISNKAMLLSRLTSAQSTLCINDVSVVKFERKKIFNEAFGNSIKNDFRIFDTNFNENNAEIIASASHNAYEINYGCTIKREIKLFKKDGSLAGRDLLLRKDSKETLKYNIRFHLYPGITATETLGGKNILIQIGRNKSLIFMCDEDKLSLEKSIFLGKNQILNNNCITISGNIVNDKKEVNWKIVKNI